MSMPKDDDLRFAVDWLKAYEGSADDPNVAAAKRVVDWLEKRVADRALNAKIRQIAQDTGKPIQLVRREFDRILRRIEKEKGRIDG